MTVVTVTDLHLAHDPNARLAQAARIARVQAGTDASRIIVRCPDRQTTGIRALRLDDIAALLQRHGRIREAAVTDGGTIVAAADVCERRGEVAIWTGQAIGPWMPSDIVERGLGGSETAAVRLAEALAQMDYIVTLFGHFDGPGIAGDVLLKQYPTFDPSKRLDALVGFRDARLFDRRPPGAERTILWLEDLAPAEGLTPARAANIDKVVAVSRWHADQVRRLHPWLEESKIVAGRNGVKLEWFRDGEG